MALESDELDLADRCASAVSGLGELLDEAFLKAWGRVCELKVLPERRRRTFVLFGDQQTDELQTELQEFLPVARRECEHDRTRMRQLDQFEEILKRSILGEL